MAADDLRAKKHTISFNLGRVYGTDADGNPVPTTTQVIQLVCRLKPATLARGNTIVENFPGANQSSISYLGWVDDDILGKTFPTSLRKQGELVGSVTIDSVEGKIDIRLRGITQASEMIGERFEALFTPSA